MSRINSNLTNDLNDGQGNGAACDLAQEKFNVRQLALDGKDAASKAMKKADKDARTGYADFAKIAAKVFKENPTAKTAVVVSSRQLADQEKFPTNVEAAYNAATTRTMYQAALSKRGYAAEAIQAEQDKLEAVTTSAAFEAAKQAATRATSERVAAMKALNTLWGEFNATAKVALKDRPDLSGLLGA